MKERLIEWMKRSSVSMHYLRLFVGGYIVYLGWCNVVDYLKGETEDGLLIGLSVFLSVSGLLIAGISLYALLRHLGTDNPPQFSLFGHSRQQNDQNEAEAESAEPSDENEPDE